MARGTALLVSLKILTSPGVVGATPDFEGDIGWEAFAAMGAVLGGVGGAVTAAGTGISMDVHRTTRPSMGWIATDFVFGAISLAGGCGLVVMAARDDVSGAAEGGAIALAVGGVATLVGILALRRRPAPARVAVVPLLVPRADRGLALGVGVQVGSF